MWLLTSTCHTYRYLAKARGLAPPPDLSVWQTLGGRLAKEAKSETETEKKETDSERASASTDDGFVRVRGGTVESKQSVSGSVPSSSSSPSIPRIPPPRFVL